ncbi:MAG: site-specific DNA-methyltransferase, partial [Alphaproteobacteria bacterium]|nr:site-specific DNA-methyltransferase [Alphaproteobacteria bacterium]
KKYNEGDNRKLFKNLFLEEGSLSSAKDELKKLGFNRENFSTPKPELLIKKILDISTNAGDLVLDSFLGSGTTCAVAHKMGRKYIGIEMGNHAKTHCVPRLEKVISGEAGGISKDINWTGGGGFKFYTLGDKVFDEYGKINPVIKFHTLASHIWFYETNNPKDNKYNDMLLGINDNTAYILLYNGILGDKKPQNGNVLTRKILSEIHSKINNHTKGFTGSIVVYGESCRLGENTLQDNNIMFKQTPYDLKI